MILQLLIVFFGGIIVGGMLEKSKITEQTNKINDQFKQILTNISRGRSIFKNRVNNTVFIGSKLEEHGDVDVIYMMDNKDVAIFKENKCIYTSEGANKEILNDLTFTIEKRFKTQIDDVVDILGFKFYREEFEKAFKVDINDIKKQFGLDLDNSDIDKIKKENESKFDIDEILDKISKQGMDSLTFEERIFLDEYSRKNG